MVTLVEERFGKSPAKYQIPKLELAILSFLDRPHPTGKKKEKRENHTVARQIAWRGFDPGKWRAATLPGPYKVARRLWLATEY